MLIGGYALPTMDGSVLLPALSLLPWKGPSNAPLLCTPFKHTAQHSTAQPITVKYSTVAYSTVRHSTAHYSAVVQCSMQDCTICGPGLSLPCALPGYPSTTDRPGVMRCGDWHSVAVDESGNVWGAVEYVSGVRRLTLSNWATYIFRPII